MGKNAPAFPAFVLYCFTLALYLSVGGLLQSQWGLPGIIFNELVFLLLPTLLFVTLFDLSGRDLLCVRWPTWREGLSVLLMTALVIAPVELMIHLQDRYWPAPPSIQEFYDNLVAYRGWAHSVLQCVALVLVPAICEEFFFRGLLQPLFVERLGVWKGVPLAAFLFGLAHANPWYLPYYFILGLYFGWLRQWRGNLALSIFAHGLNNLYSLYS